MRHPGSSRRPAPGADRAPPLRQERTNMSLSVAAVLAEPAWRTPEKIAVVEGAERRTYAQLWLEVLDLAAALRAAGVEAGDRVAPLAPNVTDFPRAYYAIIAAGGVVVPVHLLLTPQEIGYILRDSGAKLMMAHVSRVEDA